GDARRCQGGCARSRLLSRGKRRSGTSGRGGSPDAAAARAGHGSGRLRDGSPDGDAQVGPGGARAGAARQRKGRGAVAARGSHCQAGGKSEGHSGAAGIAEVFERDRRRGELEGSCCCGNCSQAWAPKCRRRRRTWTCAPSRRLSLFGITGTNGKTTTAYLIEQISAARGLGTGLIGTVEAHWPGGRTTATHTTPESHELQQLLRRMLDAGAQVVAMEVSS